MLTRQVRSLQFFRTWAVLCDVYPQSDMPVVQLSIDETKPASFHREIGKRIAPLREGGLLIVGSGNLVILPCESRWTLGWTQLGTTSRSHRVQCRSDSHLRECAGFF